jgi:hypothetical protein
MGSVGVVQRDRDTGTALRYQHRRLVTDLTVAEPVAERTGPEARRAFEILGLQHETSNPRGTGEYVPTADAPAQIQPSSHARCAAAWRELTPSLVIAAER